MKKAYRIKKSKEIDAVIKNKVSFGNKFFVIYYKENEENHFRFAISIGKKYGKAVHRNKIKRQIRMIFQNKKEILKKDYVVVVKKEAKNIQFKDIDYYIDNLINKIKETEIKNE